MVNVVCISIEVTYICIHILRDEYKSAEYQKKKTRSAEIQAPMGFLSETYNRGLRMRRECRERFSANDFKRNR